jgi:hypothetical protein
MTICTVTSGTVAPERMDFDDGKYTVINDRGVLTALRHGQPWRDLVGDNLVYWMFVTARDLKEENEALKQRIKMLEESSLQGKDGPDVVEATPGKLEVSSDGLTVTDSKSGLMWDRKHLEERLTWNEACEAVKAANESNHLGFKDWRLPTLDELQGLVQVADASTGAATIDLIAFPGTPARGFWANGARSPDPDLAWFVHFYYGYTGAVSKYNSCLVRLVRSGQ